VAQGADVILGLLLLTTDGRQKQLLLLWVPQQGGRRTLDFVLLSTKLWVVDDDECDVE
jgi:hypothetical protein